MLPKYVQVVYAFYLQYVRELVPVKYVPPPPSRDGVAGVAELFLIDASEGFFGARVWPGWYSKVHGVPRESRERVVRSPRLLERIVVGLYCESVAYKDQRKKPQVKKGYGQEFMEVTGESSSKRALKPSDVPAESERQRHQLGSVPTPSCAMQYIGDQ